MFWDQRRFVKTVKLCSRSNVPILTSASGTKKYRAFVAAQNTAWLEIDNVETETVCQRAVTTCVAYNTVDKKSNDVSVINDMVTATDNVNT